MDKAVYHSDEELLRQLSQGSKDAFEEIFNRYWYALYKVVYVRLNAHEEAEEIVQELFAVLWQKRASLQINSISDYLFMAVQHRTISHIRASIVRDKYRESFNTKVLEKHTPDTEEAVTFNELYQAIERIIGRLPEKSQQVFRLNRLEGRSVAEIARSLKMPRRTAEYHLTKSLRELRLHLKDYILFVLFYTFFF